MTKNQKVKNDYVKKQTMLAVVLVSLVIGFLGGVFFSVYKSASKETVNIDTSQQQRLREKESSVKQAGMILALEKETSLHPDNEEMWLQLGNLYFDSNNKEKAIQAYKKYLQLNPNNANVMTDMGIMYRRSGQPFKAIEAFDKAVAIDVRHEFARFNKGIVLMHDLNDHKSAIQVWEKLVSINPLAKTPNGQLVRVMLERLKKNMNQK